MISPYKMIFLLVLITTVYAETKIDRYTGTATDLKTGKLIYTEEHEARYVDNVNVGSTITYRDGKKNVIGKKEIAFENTSALVSFRREDYRFGTVESAELIPPGVRLVKKEDFLSEQKEKIISAVTPMAIDAGLNNLVRNSWNTLIQGENVVFNLAVPSQLDYFEFRVKKEREELLQNRRTLVVRFESDHWFVRVFVDPVIVWYDVETQRAVRYEGISNIYNENGESYIVRVTFDKPGP